MYAFLHSKIVPKVNVYRYLKEVSWINRKSRYLNRLNYDGLTFAKKVILSKLASTASSIHEFYETEKNEYTLFCPYCSSQNIKKNGNIYKYNYEPARNEVLYGVTKKKLNEITRSYLEKHYDLSSLIIKIQKYRCNSCGRSFLNNTNTMTQYSKLSLEIIDTYLSSMLNSDTLVKSAKACNISVYTCFFLRHKVLSMLTLNDDGLVLCGENIEMDETYFKDSFKGNTKNIKSNLPQCKNKVSKSSLTYMERKPHKRGKSDSTILVANELNEDGNPIDPKKKQNHKRGISSEKVCVVTGLDHNGNYMGLVTCMARPSIADLHHVLDGRIIDGSILHTDEMNTYKQFASDNGLELIQTNSKVKVKGSSELQTINSMHSDMKRQLDDIHRGVSSKYLNNYISWYIYVLKKDGKLHENLEGYRSVVFHKIHRLIRAGLPIRPPVSFDGQARCYKHKSYIKQLALQALCF